MHIVHRDWHNVNSDPTPPSRQDPNWGTNLVFGSNFLQMHHEMVKASSSEPRQHMMHDSVLEWYNKNGNTPPSVWGPLAEIPAELGYEPDPMAYPDEIRIPLENFLSGRGQTIEQFLTRRTNTPSFELPKYFTVQGVSSASEADPLTGAMKLSDFKNTNQLGCSLVFPHNSWHGAIGGAMSSTWTAIADPIFYWGVHWHVDRVYDEFKIIEASRSVHSLDLEALTEKGLNPTRREVRDFTDAERTKINEFVAASLALKLPIE